MKIYFHEANLDEYTDAEDVFTAPELDKHYWQYIEYGTNPGGLEEFAIYDTVGRFIPIDIEAINDLIQALYRVKELHNSITNGEQSMQLAESNANESVDPSLEW